MPGKGKEDDPLRQDWWDEKPEPGIHARYQQGVIDYIAFHDDNVEDLKFSVDLVKRIIPHVAVRDVKWKKFPVESFRSTGVYAAHTDLYTTIYNKITSLQKAMQDAREEAEEAKRMVVLKEASRVANLENLERQ